MSAPLDQWSATNSRVFAGSAFLHSGTNAFAGYSNGNVATTSTITLEQVVTIPIGVTVKVGVRFKAFRVGNFAAAPFVAALNIDDIQVATWNPNNNSWKEITPTSNALLGPTTTTSSHKISLTV